MEQWKKALLIGITLFVFAFLCLHVFVNIRGKDILSQKLEETFNRKIEIGSLYTTFPANLHIKNLKAQGLFKIDEIIAGRGLIDIFRKDFNLFFLKVVRPVITLEKGFIKSTTEALAPADINLQKSSSDNQPKAETKLLPPNLNPLAVLQNRFLPTRFSIGRLIVSDGAVNFIDNSLGDKELVIKVEHINFRVDNLNFSGRGIQITSFDLKGTIPWREGIEKGRISAEGWFNLFKKDMQTSLKIENIDGVYLYPYYSQWVDLEKARIESATLNFTSNIHGLNNNVTADCHLELTNIVRKRRPDDESPEKAERIADTILGMFKAADQGKIALHFTIRTKMDRPEFGFSDIKTAFEEKLAQARSPNGVKPENILLLPVKILEGAVKGATDVSKAVIDGTFAVGNEVKKAVEGAFKKEPE